MNGTYRLNSANAGDRQDQNHVIVQERQSVSSRRNKSLAWVARKEALNIFHAAALSTRSALGMTRLTTHSAEKDPTALAGSECMHYWRWTVTSYHIGQNRRLWLHTCG